MAFMNMIDSLKGEMNKSLKEIQEDTNNQCKEINKTVQYLKLEIKSVKKKKRQTEGILDTITITNINGISYSLKKIQSK